MQTCYLCQSTNIEKEHDRVRDRTDVKVLRCANCSLVFLDRFDHVRGEFYEDSGMFDHAPPSPELLAAEEAEDTKRRTAALANEVRGRSYLDFGCGAGNVAKELSTYAEITRVVEPNRVMRKYVTEKQGIEAFESISAIKGKYDVISLFHVLEHLEDPRTILSQLAEHLTPGGYLYVEVPSADDALLKQYKSDAFKNFTYWSCHLYLFTPSNLDALGRQSGLKTIAQEQVQRYPLANHLYWLAEGKPGGHKIWSSLRSPVLDESYAKTLGNMGLCDTLVIKLGRL